jgi:hypothetical protein
MPKNKQYVATEEVIEQKSGVQDYLTGQWVRSGVKEHKDAVNIFTKKLIYRGFRVFKKATSNYSSV